MAPKCSICKKAVAKNHRATLCDGCHLWCHIKCGNISPDQYKTLQNQTSFEWYCPLCENIKQNTQNDNEHCMAFKQLADDLEKSKGITVSHLNINGLLTKINELKLLLEETKIDIFAVSETHLHNEISDFEVSIDNYSFIRKDRENGTAWGGVIIYYKDSLNGLEFIPTATHDLEMIWLECTIQSQKLLISCVYQPPRDLTNFLPRFDNIVNQVTVKRTNVIIVGDFNIDLTKENTSNYNIRKTFNDILNKYNLCNIVNVPTRITDSSQTIIDHIIIPKTCKPKISICNAIDLALSDHHLVYCSFNIAKSQKRKPIFRICKNYKDIDIDKLRNDISNVPWQICDIFDDVDDSVYAWDKLYKSVINEHIKERKVKIRAHSHPWMNSSIRKELNKRFKLLQKAQSTPKGSREWNDYKKSRNYCTKILRIAEASYWQNKFKNLTSSSKEFWSCINSFTGKCKNSSIGPLEDINGNITTDDAAKCLSLNTYFANIGKLHKDKNNANLPCHIYRIPPTITKINYSIDKLSLAFKKVFKPGKAGGHDDVNAKVVNLIGDSVIDGLHYIAKGSFSSLKFPTNYKISRVTCIHKKGSRTKCENYRPISLLSLPGKLLEAVFASEIDNHVYNHNLLSNHQWGFRKGRSPELMLIKLTEKWLSKINNGLYVGIILIDFSKAFDSVCHQTLLKKIQAMGICGEFYEWSKSYLDNRRQFTTVGTSKSDLAPVDQGVPQGSLLGPRYYSYHANDLPTAAKSHESTESENEAEMFADDTTAITYSKSFDELLSNLQCLANRLNDWSHLNGMVIHPGKTKVIIMSRKNFIGPPPNITLNNQSLEIVDNSKLLGTFIDNKINWKHHIEQLKKSFNIKVRLLKRMLSLNSQVLEKFYYATIIPSVTYNIAVWGSCPTNSLESLDTIHAKAAKIIHRLPDNLVSTNAILDRVRWMPISYLYKRRLLCLMHKVYYNLVDPDICSLFYHPDPSRTTRRKQQLKVNDEIGSKSTNSFTCRGCKIWNAMPSNLTEIEDHKKFKSYLSTYKNQIKSYSFEYNSFHISENFVFI